MRPSPRRSHLNFRTSRAPSTKLQPASTRADASSTSAQGPAAASESSTPPSVRRRFPSRPRSCKASSPEEIPPSATPPSTRKTLRKKARKTSPPPASAFPTKPIRTHPRPTFSSALQPEDELPTFSARSSTPNPSRLLPSAWPASPVRRSPKLPTLPSRQSPDPKSSPAPPA